MTARFPPPWTAEEYRGISYIVRDANNFPVAYVYFETEPGWRASISHRASHVTKDAQADVLRARKTPRY